jgi:effector-binding domain-containing protein
MVHMFEIVEITIGPVVEVEESTFVWQMPSRFKRDYQSIAEYIAATGAEFSGMPYARYFDMNWAGELNRGKISSLFSMLFKKWHYLAGMPSTKLLQGRGRLRANNYPQRRYASTMHCGPYKNCGETYVALMKWLLEQGHTPDSEAFEFYRNDPHEVAEAELETQILIPLLS